MRTPGHEKTHATCQWCGKEVTQVGRGRPRKFCSPSCKQRAYEQRNSVVGTQIPADAVIMTQDRAASLRDGLFELRCSAEDIATAAAEGASAGELKELCDDLVSLARRLEELK
ncbi:hypothetical protein [uncultured Corynebacterium sp.]|uniref:hypothetical protein n=1 Tax=uncultured Corynebacterium sp. TaxID=159447 RepID=UPI0025D7A89D|nr:hypothetical protein [uncultured Corynebacterium sp.]